jgi:outer membrane protease
VPKTGSHLSAWARVALTLAAYLPLAAPASAGDYWVFRPFEEPAPSYTADFGLRFWYGKASTAKNLLDNSGSQLVSRLTYGDLSLYAAEGYGRIDLNKRWFVKGYIGGGTFRNGSLKDEDWGLPPPFNPYSATLSALSDPSLFYASIDAGANVLWGPDFRVGLFGGFHYLSQTISAFGCTQIANNPLLCGTIPIPNWVRGITQQSNWYSARVGFDATVEIDRFKFSLDAAYLPYVWFIGTDTHHLRVGDDPGSFTGAVPEDGHGWGYQLDAFVSYRVYEALSVGIGGRYWFARSRGFTHFEGHVVDMIAFPQVVEWKTQNFGVFVQASLKLGPYSVLDVH